MEVLAMIRKNIPEMKASMALSQCENRIETRFRGVLPGGSGLVGSSWRLAAFFAVSVLIVSFSSLRTLAGAESAEGDDATDAVEEETVVRKADIILSLAENGKELSFQLKGEAAVSLTPVRLVWLSPEGLLRLEESSEGGGRILEFRAGEDGVPQGVMKKNRAEVPLDAEGLQWMVSQLKKLGQLPAETNGRGIFLLPREQQVVEVEVLAGPEDSGGVWVESAADGAAEHSEDSMQVIVSPDGNKEISFRGEIRIEGDPPQASIDWDGNAEDLPAILNRQKTMLRRHLRDQGQELKQLQEKLRKEGIQFKLDLKNQLDSDEFQSFYEEQGRLFERLLDAQQEKLEALDSELNALTDRLKNKLDREAGRSMDSLRNLLERQDGLLRQLLEKELGGLELLQDKLAPLLKDEQTESESGAHSHQDVHDHGEMDSDAHAEGHGEINHADEVGPAAEKGLEEAEEDAGSHVE
jgi:arsenate reductase-like glutaredoxin family protein